MIRFSTAVAVALLAVAVVAVPTGRADLVNGATYDYWYRWDAGANLFYYGNQAYTRALVSTPGFWSCGYYYPGSSYYRYTAVYPAQAYSTVPAYGDGWRSQLLGLAKQRDKYELENRRLAIDQAAYIESIKALGLTGNFTIQGYGQGVNYPNAVYPAYGLSYGYNPNLGSYGANGQTLYGYSYSQVQQAYGGLNLNTMYQQASRLTAGAQALAGQAHTENIGLVDSIATNAARVSEVLAKGEAAERALRAANAPASTTTVTTVSGANVGAVSGSVAAGGAAASNTTSAGAGSFLATVATPVCGSCHGGNAPKGGFNITKAWPDIVSDPAKKAVVLERLFTRDPEKHMPRGADGKSAELTPEQKMAFMEQLK